MTVAKPKIRAKLPRALKMNHNADSDMAYVPVNIPTISTKMFKDVKSNPADNKIQGSLISSLLCPMVLPTYNKKPAITMYEKKINKSIRSAISGASVADNGINSTWCFNLIFLWLQKTTSSLQSSYTWSQREMNKSLLCEILIIGVYAKQQPRIT